MARKLPQARRFREDDLPMRVRGPEAISPTAHYTGHVWVRNGLSHPELATREGRVMYEALRPAMTLSGVLGGPTLESYLLARHRAIDALLERVIEQDGVTQVIELACGLSPRGWRFTRRYGRKLTYVEADLPGMAERKRRALARMGSLGERHRVEVLDALREQGPGSLAALTGALNPDAGLAIVTEGLLGYLEREVVERMWSRFASQLAAFRVGRYFADVQLGDEAGAHVHAFRAVLSVFVRGRVHLHFTGSDDAATALRRAGFSDAAVNPAAGLASSNGRSDPGARLAHVLQAGVGRLDRP
jgi:O-methyltransferase involved in polyketide biosynthesis